MGPSEGLIVSYYTFAGPVGPYRGASETSPWDLRERIEAAARAGFAGVGLVHDDLVASERRIGFGGIRTILDDAGIRHLELEMLNDWFADGERRRASDAVRADLLRGAAELGARQIKIGPDYTGGRWPLERMVEAFAGLCDEAAAAGTRVALEPMPFSNLPTPAAALEVIRGAGRPNGGLILDTWHVARAGVPFERLREIPGREIVAVELDDAPLRPAASLLDETLDARRLCGEGELDVRGFVESVLATGFDGPFGVEILSAEHRARPLEEAVERAFATTIAQFAPAAADA